MITLDYNTRKDIEELRDDAFSVISSLGLLCAMFLIWFAVGSVVESQNSKLLVLARASAPLWLSAVLLIAAYLTWKRRQRQIAKGLLLAALMLGATLQVLLHGPSLATYMIFVLPIAIANIAVGKIELRICALTVLLMFLSTFAQIQRAGVLGLYDALSLTWLPGIVCLSLAIVIRMNTEIVFTTLQWAIDSKNKDERRAQLLQLKQAELDKTILDLKIAHSELEQLNNQLSHAKEVAEDANRLKTQFVANMSHELRTPLNAIINFTEFLDDEDICQTRLSDQQRIFQQRTLANAEHLLGLINDILDLAKIEAGRMELYCEELNLSVMLQSMMSTTIGLTRDKQLTLNLELPEELPTVWGDKTRIRQILLNLLSNAAKFTRQGSITLQALQLDDNFVRVSVQDSGIGIPQEKQQLIFEEFRQIDGELTREHSGTGLGLPISKRLIELHGGKIWLESVEQQGTTFYLTLPIKAQSASNELLPAQTAVHTDRPQVVVVDDNPSSQEIFKHHLESMGFSVHPVLDSRLALATIQQIRPRLIILDLIMPHLDGWNLLTQLKSIIETADIPVVICSIVDDKWRGLSLGAVDYLVKPIREPGLMAVIKRFVPTKGKIMIIDDDSNAREIFRLMLESAGYAVREAANGRVGLADVQSQQPNLILLDLSMPEMDGFEVLEHLANDPRTQSIPVIVISALDLSQEERSWLVQRTEKYLRKHALPKEQFLEHIYEVLAEHGFDKQQPSHGQEPS